VDLAPLRFFCTVALICLVLAFAVDLGSAAAGSGTWVAALLGMVASGLSLAWLSLRQLRRRRRRGMTELDRALTIRARRRGKRNRSRVQGGQHAGDRT
jgi:hypothetical protein